MSESWRPLHSLPPSLTPAVALATLADQAELWCLDGGPGGWVYVAAPKEAHWLNSLADVPQQVTGSADVGARGWPAYMSEGWLVQCDYGMPVGRDAAPVAVAEVAGRAARIDALLAWNPQGAGWLCGESGAAAALWDLLQRPARTLSALSLRQMVQPQWSAAAHQDKVSQLRAAIADGVCFQGNLAVPFSAPIADPAMVTALGSDIHTFLALRAASPAPYAAFWRQGGGPAQGGRSICSHSPECFLQGDGQRLRSEPIKGTRARVHGAEAQTVAALLASAKDRAELAMIVDLVRNDLGRIATTGSVRVEAAAEVMDLDYVHHLVAVVSAQPRAATTVHDWLAAAFPAGSITGAPKIEVMSLLQRLEGVVRGPYCGCFGWLGARSCALAVAIRSMVIDGEQITFAAGGGIVADSQPQAEWEEVLAKAQRMTAILAD